MFKLRANKVSFKGEPEGHCNCVVVLEDAVEQKRLTARYLMSAAEHIGHGRDMMSLEHRSSPWEELPSSPETFGIIPNYQLSDEVNNDDMRWKQQLGLVDSVSTVSVVASSFSGVNDIDSSDSATVPESELSTEDMWLDVDEAISDVIMDPLKLADIGLYLPPVSADDVDSLLSSPSCVSTAVPAVVSVGLETEPYHVMACDFMEQISVSNPLLTAVEPSVNETCSPVYKDQVRVSSPLSLQSEDQVQLPSPVSLQSEDQFQLSSPASTQSSTSVPSSEKKQRKKEQNKTAAQKYRQKKRGEQGVVMTEYEQLERKNIELHTRVEEMTREVNYLKGLIEEICA